MWMAAAQCARDGTLLFQFKFLRCALNGQQHCMATDRLVAMTRPVIKLELHQRSISSANAWAPLPFEAAPIYLHSGGSSPEPGGPCPRWRPDNVFRQYINIITKPTAYDGPREY